MTALESSAKLKQVLLDTFLLTEEEFSFDLLRRELDGWDSLGSVVLGLAVEESFGCRMTDDEALRLRGFRDLIDLLEKRGIHFD